MSVFPKFIIETRNHIDVMIIGKCKYHKELALNSSNVKGGGWWSLDDKNKVFTLHGNSSDFGAADIEDIYKCIQSKSVYSSRSLNLNYTDEYKFMYREYDGNIIDFESYMNASNNNSFNAYLIEIGFRSEEFTYDKNQLYDNIDYFKECHESGLSAYKALIFLNDRLYKNS